MRLETIYFARLHIFKLKFGLKFLISALQSMAVFALMFAGGIMVLNGCLLRQDNDSALKELLAAYEDGSASWLYTRALVAFRESGDSDEQAAALVRGAWSANQHVPAILAGTKPPVISDDGYVTMGGPDEATYYVTECGPAWHRTPGAVAWLTKLAATMRPKQRTRTAVH